MKISDQKNELASMNEQIKDIIKSRSEAKFKARKLKWFWYHINRFEYF